MTGEDMTGEDMARNYAFVLMIEGMPTIEGFFGGREPVTKSLSERSKVTSSMSRTVRSDTAD
jgi:hypothetical protein